MDIARLVLEYLQALIWPGITIAAILIFRKQLRQLLTNIASAVHRVTKLTAPGTTVELINDLNEKVELINLTLGTDDLQAATKDNTGTPDAPTKDNTGTPDAPTKDNTGTPDAPTKDASSDAPTTSTGTPVVGPSDESLDDLTRGKIIRIWNEIDSSLQELVRINSPWFEESSRPRRGANIPAAHAIYLLANNTIISTELAASLIEARRIRNLVIHDSDAIPLGAFDDYLRTISKLNAFLKALVEVF